jgi:hypothetical protein
VLEAVFILLEPLSPSRRIFIGSHSLPHLWFAISVLQWRHYPIILQGLKHIRVMDASENVVDEDGGDEAWEHPKASSLESSTCFIPSAGVDPCDELIQLSPSSCGGGFLVNGVSSMIGCGGHRKRELLVDRGGARSTGTANRGKKGLG